jgi:thioredoxin-like negative regulator of GroEL
MSTLCIGGVCIPYSAIVPFLIFCLKWLWEKVQRFLQPPTTKNNKDVSAPTKPSSTDNVSSSPTSNSSSSSSSLGKTIIQVSSDSHWKSLLRFHQTSGGITTVVAQFTASWCEPCHRIAPTVEQLAAQSTAAQVVVVNVDTCPQTADQYKAAILPTFVCLHHGQEVARYVGSDGTQLQRWFQEHA